MESIYETTGKKALAQTKELEAMASELGEAAVQETLVREAAMVTAKKVLDIARLELGTKESPPDSNNVKYNSWFYGRPVSGRDYAWCMVFIQWLFCQAGKKLPYITASCSALLNWYNANRPSRVVKTPQPGDIIIYSFGHTGIVETVGSDGTITAIEGNTSSSDAGSQSNGGMVCRRKRTTSTVKAYIRPDYEKGNDMNIDKISAEAGSADAERAWQAAR